VPDFDLLVLSGDTAHDEEPATYESVRKELGDLAGRVRVIPGNHDDRQALRDVFRDSTSGLAGRVSSGHGPNTWRSSQRLPGIACWNCIRTDGGRPRCYDVHPPELT
jgi:predicted MPP superfamily phosphohydrolase